ncbi:MAG: SDR family oxidoreductase [Gemmatimonadales bacterium]|nr:SDR family oxidoreductase [Gemmatimonadales bacterium]
MILVVGASGTLGRQLVPLLTEAGHRVRALTRTPSRAGLHDTPGVEVVPGDLRDPESLRAATQGVTGVISASHAITGSGRGASARVDDAGQRALLAAARDAGVTHFTFISVLGASATHPIDFWRTKWAIEGAVRASGIPHAIIRPSAFMDFHAYELIGKAVLRGKRVVLFGAGDRPRNFVAAADVARLVVRVLAEARDENVTLEIDGPEDLSSMDVVRTFARVAGREAKVTHLPMGMARALARLARPLHEGVARVLQAAVHGETVEEPYAPDALLARFPMPLTRLEEWARARAATIR